MALINDKEQWIYIRVPRTGSSSYVKELHDVKEIGNVHSSARHIRDLYPEEWREYRTFGVIRNPWDWLVSAYSVGWFAGPEDRHEPWPGERELPPDAPYLDHYGQRMNLTFPEWVKKRKTTCMDWLVDGHRVLVDQVLRFEDMPLVHWEQKTDRHHYREYYDDDLIKYVARKCRREIDIGGYEF